MPLTRDVVTSRRPKPSPVRRASARSPKSTLDRMVRDARAIAAQLDSTNDSMGRIATALAPAAEARRAARASDEAFIARAERCTPAAVQAANAARWPRR